MRFIYKPNLLSEFFFTQVAEYFLKTEKKVREEKNIPGWYTNASHTNACKYIVVWPGTFHESECVRMFHDCEGYRVNKIENSLLFRL